MAHSGRDFCRHRDIMDIIPRDQPWKLRIKDASVDLIFSQLDWQMRIGISNWSSAVW